MPFAEQLGVRLCYETAGVGRPLLLVGGTAGDLRAVPGPFAWPGAENFAAAAFDHRGLGRSSLGPSETPTVADYATDALALVDHIGWDEFSVIGVSFGGMVAQELAIVAGARLNRMVLISTTAAAEGSYPIHELYGLPAVDRVARLAELLDTRAAEAPELAAAIRTHLEGEYSLAAPGGPTPGLLGQLEARRGHDASGRLQQIPCPVLIVAGRFDGIAPPAAARRLARAIPASRLRTFEGGHGSALLMQDQRAWREITRFLLDT
jgi:3-oxoadipate enol-lactonase